MEAFLADLVTGVHLAVVLFVVLLPPLVLAGAWRGWAWIRRPLLRVAHLGIMTYIVGNAVRGELCFLTHWEWDLREAAGQTEPQDLSFVGGLLHDLLFLDVEQAVLDRWYLAFGVLVLLVTVAVPPRRNRTAGEERRRSRRGRTWG